MSERSFLYASSDDRQIDYTHILASWNGVPLTFQIMVSQGAHLMYPINDEQRAIAIAGDYAAGRGRLFTFLETLRLRGLFDETQLKADTDEIASVLFTVTPTPAFAILQLDDPSNTGRTRVLLAAVSNIEDQISRYLTQWTAMKYDEQFDEMWRQLGVGQPPPQPADNSHIN